MKIQDFQDNVTCGGFDNIFANIYKPQDIESQKSRYMECCGEIHSTVSE